MQAQENINQGAPGNDAKDNLQQPASADQSKEANKEKPQGNATEDPEAFDPPHSGSAGDEEKDITA